MKPRLLEDVPLSVITPADGQAEPYGETPYLERVEYYAEHARAHMERGARELVIRGMPDLHEARAGVLGARVSGLPVYVSLRLDDHEPEELLAALICLQALDVAAFGLDIQSVSAETIELFSLLAPYANAPLLARADSPVSAEACSSLLCAGADILAVSDEAQAEAAKKALESFCGVHRAERPEDAPILLGDTSGVYYLEEDFTLSEEIECSRDMLEEIIEQEDMAFDALCFRLETVDDAHFLGLNAHMVRCAVCMQAAGPEALEMGLMLYSGRALVDARSDVEERTLEELAVSYGAVIR